MRRSSLHCRLGVGLPLPLGAQARAGVVTANTTDDIYAAGDQVVDVAGTGGTVPAGTISLPAGSSYVNLSSVTGFYTVRCRSQEG